MGILQGVIVGFKEIWAHKLRSFLTMLGVILGVAALASMFAFVEGMFAGWKYWIEDAGGIQRLTTQDNIIPSSQTPFKHIAEPVKVNDVHVLRAAIDKLTRFSPEYAIPRCEFTAGNKKVSCMATAVTDTALAMQKHEIAQGRFITPVDRYNKARVAVIGAFVAAELFGKNGNALGRRICVNKKLFRVVGVLKEQQGIMGRHGHDHMSWKNRVAFVPLETGLALFSGKGELSEIGMDVCDSGSVPFVAETAQNVMFLSHRRIWNISIGTNEEMLQRFSEITGSFSISLGIIAGISLIVGGIGIMNIMLASINERIREIGIRKAIGARNRDVLVQVLVEAVVLSLVGGILGVFVSLLLTKTITIILADSFSVPVVRMGALLFSGGVSVAVGVVFGLYPAWRAAKLDPIEALRYE